MKTLLDAATHKVAREYLSSEPGGFASERQLSDFHGACLDQGYPRSVVNRLETVIRASPDLSTLPATHIGNGIYIASRILIPTSSIISNDTGAVMECRLMHKETKPGQGVQFHLRPGQQACCFTSGTRFERVRS